VAVISTMIVGERGLLRGVLRAVLHDEGDIEVVADVADPAAALDLALVHRPDSMIVDIDSTSGPGFDLADRIGAALPGTAIIVLSGQRTPNALRRALRAQARAFLSKEVRPGELVAVLRRAVAGERVIDAATARATLTAAANPLTNREREVLRAAARGLQPREIAASLFLAYGTVRNVVSAALRKTGGRNQWEAVRRAEDAGWL
jgi:two-component system response regulator DesR